MNINTIINKFKFKKINNLGFDNIQEGVYRNKTKGVALLKNGKVIASGYKYFSKNISEDNDSANKAKFYGENLNGYFDIFNTTGECLTPQVYENVSNKTIDENGHIIVKSFMTNSSADRLLLIPSKGFLSEDYCSIKNYESSYKEQKGWKEVSKENHYGLIEHYLIDEDGDRMSCNFVDRTIIPELDLQIFTILENNGNEVEALFDKNFMRIGGLYKNIEYVGEGLILATDTKGNEFYINKQAMKITNAIKESQRLNNNLTIVKEKGKSIAKILNENFEVLLKVKRPVVFEEAGVIVGLVKNQPVMFGYNIKKRYPVHEATARLMVSKLMGKRMSPIYVNKVIEDESFVVPTIQTFDQIVKDNLKIDAENETLKYLQKYARRVFLQSLNVTSANRIRRCAKNLEEIERTKLALLTKSETLKEQQVVFAEFKEKIKQEKTKKNMLEKGEEE